MTLMEPRRGLRRLRGFSGLCSARRIRKCGLVLISWPRKLMTGGLLFCLPLGRRELL
ncbi:hypothetical protein MtrunA17_Chr7g0229461 [Medicago truncatula]|uniref:Uncharacterized protein n=1 Tax=Medicago truncatula TaxID=3880 RepID=A0A396H2H4_MEDTR|nr:hypothetical protein MtrunA17_Chr7g0229461 [Medicago truncatula]